MTVTEEDIKEVIKSLNKHLDYNYRGHEVEDMKSAAYLGVTKAIYKFDPKKASFKTYAYRRGMGEAMDYIRQQPSLKYRHACKRARVIPFSIIEAGYIKEQENNMQIEKTEHVYGVSSTLTTEYNLQEIKEKILDYYAHDINSTSEIKAKIITDYFIDGIPKYKLAEKYNVTRGCISQFTNESNFMKVLNKVLQHCVPT